MQMPYRQHLACQFACLERFSRNPRYRLSVCVYTEISPKSSLPLTSQFACLQRFHRNPRYRLQVSLHVDRWFSRNPRYRSPVCMLTKRFPHNPRYRLPNGSRYELLKNTSDAWKGKIFLIKIQSTMYCTLTDIPEILVTPCLMGEETNFLKNTRDAWKGKIFLVKIQNTMYKKMYYV